MKPSPGAPDPYGYALPPELIAQDPAPRRGDARLLLVARGGGVLGERRARDLPALLRPGDLLVLNDSRVLPARLRCAREGGGGVELLLVRAETPRRWLALARPARRLRLGSRLVVLAPAGQAPEARGAAPALEVVALGGEGFVTVEGGADEDDLAALAERWGVMPLPPYIRRAPDDPQAAPRWRRDRERYQTVYAREAGSVAAPTAGLHLEPEGLAALRAAGVELAAVTLHVGPGTFRPPGATQLVSGRLHAEAFVYPAATDAAVRRARAGGGRVVAVGTTALRVLETVRALELGPLGGPARVQSAASADDPAPLFSGTARRERAGWRVEGVTRLFLRPPARVEAADALLTNFHLPGSSLLMLVAAMAGQETWRAAYAHAVAKAFRFYSYGDAMLLLPPGTRLPATGSGGGTEGPGDG